ncbi:MAG: LruC domain-containing protein [SAR202 cluster bacterium]|jgi:LruC domain-containing protein|nr:LruC domain-containing protein [SAR202 cluster bacterium]
MKQAIPEAALAAIGVVLSLAIVAGPVSAQETVTYSPAEGEFGVIMFEDQWPCAGDLDYNDVVLRVNTAVTHDGPNVSQIALTVFPQALGSNSVSSGLALHLPASFGTSAEATVFPQGDPSSGVVVDAWLNESTLVYTVYDDVRDAFGGVDGFINTDLSGPFFTAEPVTLEITFPAPVSIDPLPTPFDVFLYRTHDRSHQVHRPEYEGTDQMDESLFNTCDDVSTAERHFITSSGLPSILFIDESLDDAAWPVEGESIMDAFPLLADAVESGEDDPTEWWFEESTLIVVHGSDIPEPTSLALLTLGGLTLLRRRKRGMNSGNTRHRGSTLTYLDRPA